jgi:hypothetical protein
VNALRGRECRAREQPVGEDENFHGEFGRVSDGAGPGGSRILAKSDFVANVGTSGAAALVHDEAPTPVASPSKDCTGVGMATPEAHGMRGAHRHECLCH